MNRKGTVQRRGGQLAIGLALTAALSLAASTVLLAQTPRRRTRGCPSGSVSIEGRYCIDRYEASLVEVVGRRGSRAWSPYVPPDRTREYRAVSRSGRVPQAYISQIAARAACRNAGRRLCTEQEWAAACRGPQPSQYPYGDQYVRGRCNDGVPNPVPRLFPGSADVFHERQMNDPRINQLPDTVARSGSHLRCRNRYGVFDMVGNLHEWVDTVHHNIGTFRGGFFSDVHQNGNGCSYATRAHYPGYHDYSTGFRCCADLR